MAEIKPVEGNEVQLGFDPDKMPSLDDAIGEGAELSTTQQEVEENQTEEQETTTEEEQTSTEETAETTEESTTEEDSETQTTEQESAEEEPAAWFKDEENDLWIKDEDHAKAYIPNAQKYIKTLEGENALHRTQSVEMVSTIEKLQQENAQLRTMVQPEYGDVPQEEYDKWKMQPQTSFDVNKVRQGYQNQTYQRNEALMNRWVATNHPGMKPEEVDAIYNLAEETNTGIKINEFGLPELAGFKALDILYAQAFPGKAVSQSQKAAEKAVKTSMQQVVAAPKSTGKNGTVAAQSPLMPHEAKAKYGEDSDEYKQSYQFWSKKVPIGS